MIEIDSGYYFGIGAFETVLVHKGIPFFINEHINRMNEALKYLDISYRISLDNCFEYIRINSLVEGVLKIVVSERNVHFMIRENNYTDMMYQNGFKLGICSFRRNETSPLTYYKTINYADNIIAKKQALLKGYDEVLFLNMKDEICEGSYTNIFFIKDGRIYTPMKSCGLLSGIIREYIIKTESVTECIISLKNIDKFEECFITNSIIGIMSVRKIGEISFDSTYYTEIVRKKYQQFIKNYSVDSV